MLRVYTQHSFTFTSDAWSDIGAIYFLRIRTEAKGFNTDLSIRNVLSRRHQDNHSFFLFYLNTTGNWVSEEVGGGRTAPECRVACLQIYCLPVVAGALKTAGERNHIYND